VLKGGFALELRYGWGNRPTKDIDIRAAADLPNALVQLRTTIAEADSNDHFSFEIDEIGQELQGAPGGTFRLEVHARLAGISFAHFHVDLSSGDALVLPPNILEGSDLLAFAGVEPLRFPVYPVQQHLAEKLHAYSLPRTNLNTRVKDLVDLVVLSTREPIDGTALLACVQATFTARATHSLPARLPEPSAEWIGPYARLAGESASILIPTDLQSGFSLVTVFWNPVLDGTAEGQQWIPNEQKWAVGE